MGGLIAVLLFIGFAILCAGHRHRHRPMMMRPPGWGMWMGPREFGPPPPPRWGGQGDYYWRGWNPGPWQENPGGAPGPQAPQAPAPGPRG